MSRPMKVIENPEVPGLEDLLPPPPSPPPPPIISDADINRDLKLTPISSAVPEKRAKVAVIENSVDSKIAFAPRNQNEMAGSTIAGVAINPEKAKSTADSSENVTRPFATSGTPVFPESMQRHYFPQIAVEQLPGVEQPWWVPTESDTADVVPQSWIEKNATWMDPNNQTMSPSSKTNVIFIKRKSECIDPAQDAERVANAQRELSALMKPLKCDLCNAIMNSTLQAKLHYDGKPHQKKVSMFLNQSVKKIKPDDGQVTSTTSSGDWNTYCEVCKTWFTSQIDASQHYAGKKHIRATTGGTKQKTKKPATPAAPVDPTGRFGIGVPFSTDVPATIVAAVEQPLITPVTSPVVSPVTNYQAATWTVPIFRCELCGVTANRPEQLKTHKRGARHLRMLRTSLPSVIPTAVLGLPATIDDTNDSGTTSSIDYSIHRTPSGQYYCAPCNRSFHSENSFAQHIDSKKHKTQVNPKLLAPPIVTATKKTNKSSK